MSIYVNDRIMKVVDALPNHSYKHYLDNKPMSLSAEMASALGSIDYKRKQIRVLATVIEAIVSKLEVKDITINDSAIQTQVNQWLATNKWDLLEKEIYKAVVRDGKTFVLTAFVNNIPALYQIDLYDGKRGAYIEYSDTHQPLYAVNTWYNKDYTTRYLDIYYTDRIEKYMTDNDGDWIALDTIDWTDRDGNPLGIAIIEVCVNGGESDLANGAVQLQNDINDALLDMIAISRTQGWPQKFIKNASQGQYLSNMFGQPWLNSSGFPTPRTEKTTPGSTKLLGKDEEMGQLDANTADNTVFNTLLHALTLSTTVPTYYFTGAEWPSGISIANTEIRLNHKIETHQSTISPAFQTMISMMLVLSNTFGGTAYRTDNVIEITWYPPQILTEDLLMQQEHERVANVAILKGSGILSTEDALRMVFPEKSETEIAAMVARALAENTIPAL